MNTTVKYNPNLTTSNVTIARHENGTNSVDNGHANGTKTKSIKRELGPKMFERCTNSWWNPKFSSKLLQKEYVRISLPLIKSLFRHFLLFTILSCIAWIIYYLSMLNTSHVSSWIPGAIWAVVLAVVCVTLLVVTKQDLYSKYHNLFELVIIVFVMVTGLLASYFTRDVMTSAGSFITAVQIVLMIYLLLPLPIPVTLITAVVFTIINEVLLHAGQFQLIIAGSSLTLTKSILGRLFLLIALHLIGIHSLFNLQILRHDNFSKILELVKSIHAKEKKEEFKEVMIKTVMPLSVARQLEEKKKNDAVQSTSDNPYRTYLMDRMHNVSILYADIVGFTQMSTNKTAAELVGLLNDLFGRFDRLCETTGCEKISTLGDCYYCVAGCPESKPDHAKCCVEMGLGMIVAIKEFCKQNNTNVNMRVGIHTGDVLCGIVGLKRRKFDVFSNDVLLANGMEQHGIPGRIHVSQDTFKCLGEAYEVEDSKLETRSPEFRELVGGPTYLIVKPKKSSSNKDQDDEQHIANNSETGDRISNLGTTTNPESEKKNVPVNNQPASEPLLFEDQQLSEYLGQHISPIAVPGPLSRMREMEDRKLIEDVQNYKETKRFYKIESVDHRTLTFFAGQQEAGYRSLCEKEVTSNLPIETCISPRYRIFLDLVLSSCITALVFVASIFLLEAPASNTPWIVTFVILLALVVTLSILVGLYVFARSEIRGSSYAASKFFAQWNTRHIVGAIILLIPAAIVFSHFACQPSASAPSCANYVILGGLVILQLINFDQLLTWMKLALACIIGIIVLTLVYTSPCPQGGAAGNVTSLCQFLDKENGQRYEFIVDIILLIAFIFFINRHYELGYRLNYSGLEKIKEIEEETSELNESVEWLLGNFIPNHVRLAMKDSPCYSKTHKKVGVIFATIVNFNELYQEDYDGGLECIRYLSELIGDIDELLNREEFKDIEKIKTIGTTFMIASGLHPDTDQETTGVESHLARLMEFCIEMQNAVDTFTESMVNFRLILRIGFNHGEVTAGVIGTTKQLYDIWGDTVNTASRMDSTGQSGRIQVSEESMLALEKHFKFEYRGKRFVKGKGEMKTYLLVRDDEDQRQLPVNPTCNYSPS